MFLRFLLSPLSEGGWALLSQFNAVVCLAVGTTWDKDFRICLVLANLKVDQVFPTNSEFYVPEEQVSVEFYEFRFNAFPHFIEHNEIFMHVNLNPDFIFDVI